MSDTDTKSISSDDTITPFMTGYSIPPMNIEEDQEDQGCLQTLDLNNRGSWMIGVAKAANVLALIAICMIAGIMIGGKFS
jgi:hypothetical protein